MSDFSDEEVSRRVSKARTFLLLDHPFFATLLLHMQPIRRDQDFDTMATDGNYLYYNGDFVMGLDMDELVGVLAHEAMHPAMAHHLRRMEREPRRWNVAADYAINPIIIDSGLKLPKNALINPKYKGMMAEEIYNLLPEQPKNAKSDPGGCGGVMDGKNSKGEVPSKAEREQMESEGKIRVAQAAAMAKARGKLPESIEALVSEMLEPKVSWADLLRNFVAKILVTDTTWSNPSRRFAHMGIVFPGPLKEGCGEIVVGVDTSGSIYCDPVILQQFLGEINSILEDVKPERTHIVYCDAKVQHVQTFETGDTITPATFKVKGGGGTAFEPVFDWSNQNAQPQCVIYLTDLMGSFPSSFGAPTIWVCANNDQAQAPFGEVIHVKAGK